MSAEAAEKQIIRQMLRNWVLWRDAGDWERFQSLWHDDGYMVTMWFQGPAGEFVRLCREGWHRAVNIQLESDGMSVDVCGHRAIAQTKIKIFQRGHLHNVLCDVVGIGRFYDFLEKRAGNWGIVLRKPDRRKGLGHSRQRQPNRRSRTRGSAPIPGRLPAPWVFA